MPVEIRELHIKAVVSESTQQSQQQPVNIDLAKMKKEILRECIQEVMEKLKEKNER